MVDGIRKLIRKVTGAEKRQLQTVEGKLLAAMNAATETADKVNINQTANGNVQYSLKNVNGKNVVWILNKSLKSKDLQNYSAIAEYIRQHIGDVYTVLEDGQKVYLGKDLPDEYTRSKYTTYLRENDRSTFRAKSRAAEGLGELIEGATNGKLEVTKHPKNKDAKYGMYRYDSSFAFPVFNSTGDITNVRAYDVQLLVRNASDGKKIPV